LRNLLALFGLLTVCLTGLVACQAPAAATPTAVAAPTVTALTTVAPTPTTQPPTDVPTATAAPAVPLATVALPAETATLPPKPDEALFQLVKADRTVVNFTVADLKKLPFASIMVGAKPQEGPALLEVLNAAGVSDFRQVTVSGQGSVTLTKEQVTPQVVLDFANRGTVKIASPELPIPSPAKDITLIVVE
jgi:hypothetical protein